MLQPEHLYNLGVEKRRLERFQKVVSELFIVQRVDGIQLRSLVGGIEAEEQPDGD